MIKVFHLATCSTCQRILKEWAPGPEVQMREIKSAPITEEEIDKMKELAGSYEALFSRRAMKYRGMGLHEMELTEADYRKYILEEYTFLKRPVVLTDDQVFVGNTKKVVAAAASVFQ
ncbi:MAG: ArsC/Spx/MgsR family protein [Bacteroidota bacterium]